MNRGHSEGGFTLIELMIGLTLSLLLLAGIGGLFVGYGAAQRRLSGLAVTLDNGRFAMGRIESEVRNASGDYCNAFANALPTAGLTPRRPMLFGTATPSALPAWVPAPAGGTPAPYPIDPGLLIRGYECAGDAACTPELPQVGSDINVVWPVGVAAQHRVPGTDVLTIRYLRGNGVPVAHMANAAAPIQLPNATAAATLELASAGLALIADCARSEVFVAEVVGQDVLHHASLGNADAALGGVYRRQNDARVFNFARDFVSVTYFVGFLPDLAEANSLRPVLLRMENGGEPQEVVADVERFDLNFDVIAGDGRRSSMDAAAVDANAGALPCPPSALEDSIDDGCLWRAIAAVDIAALFASPKGAVSRPEAFRYSIDGDALQAPEPDTLMPHGLPAEWRLRREFRAQVAIRNVLR